MTVFGIISAPLDWLIYIVILVISLEFRENGRRKFLGVLLICFVLQFFIRFCMFTEIAWIQEINFAKLLTFVMISFLIFVGGRYVHGGWSVVGFYILMTDVLIGLITVLFWQVWGAVTHASQEELVNNQQWVEVNPAVLISLLFPVILIPLFGISIKNIQKHAIIRSWIVKVAVIGYLASAVAPFIWRIGFQESVQPTGMFLWHLVALLVVFWIMLAIQNSISRENAQILYLKKNLAEEQSRLIQRQEKETRYLRHDIKRHLQNLEYFRAGHPEMENDADFVQYRDELMHFADTFRQTVFCDSPEMNLCLSQMAHYCEEEKIPVSIRLKRLQFSGWTTDDQVLFGASLNQLLLKQSGVLSVRIIGDCIQGQNIMRLKFETKAVAGSGGSFDEAEAGTGSGGSFDEAEAVAGNGGSLDEAEAVVGKRGSFAEKRAATDATSVRSIRRLLRQYEGDVEQKEATDGIDYVMTWREMGA